MPLYYWLPFKTFETVYAFDFIKRDWKMILTAAGFTDSDEHLWFNKYVRLLIAKKNDGLVK
jgi:hypothetical protein